MYRVLLRCATNAEEMVSRIGCPIYLSIPRLGKRLAERYHLHPSVDVVGLSMGGIVAREAARRRHPPRLCIARLYTLATPHLGARSIAWLVPHHQAQSLLQHGAYLNELNDDPDSRSFHIETFSITGDHMVGPHSAHGIGDHHHPWPNVTLNPGHHFVHADPRILMTVVGKLLGHLP